MRDVLNHWLRNATVGGGRLHERESSAKQQSLQGERCEERHEGGDYQSYESKHRFHGCSPLLNLTWAKSGLLAAAGVALAVCGLSARHLCLVVRDFCWRDLTAEQLRDLFGAFRKQ